MSIPRTVADVLSDHVTFTCESIDRMYLNAYVPGLQFPEGVISFFCRHRGKPVASSALMDPITKAFVAAIEAFAAHQNVPLIIFERGQRKEEVMGERLRTFDQAEGVVFIGKAQEKAHVFRTEKRRHPVTGRSCPWLVPSTAMVNYYYFYCVDAEFGPFFLKFCSYFPYTAKLCLNGHEYAKRQLAKQGIGFQALDNGFVSCQDGKRLDAICQQLGPEQIEALLQRWLARLPHPFTPEDQQAGYDYQLSILQAEFSLTQILDRPLSGRIFFEEVIRENLDLGRPEQVQLIFQRRVPRNTRARFRTRVITHGVVPSLHVDYKSSRIKQYFKQIPGVAQVGVRTETTINNGGDFRIGKRLCNLSAWGQIGFQANRRILEVEHLSQDCAVAEDTLQQLNRPLEVNGQRTSALRTTEARVLMLFHLLICFRLLPCGFQARDLRAHLAVLTGQPTATITQGKLTYQLRRLRLHGMIARLPHHHRYEVTPFGLRVAFFFTRAHARLYRPAMPAAIGASPPANSALGRRFRALETEIDRHIREAKIAA